MYLSPLYIATGTCSLRFNISGTKCPDLTVEVDTFEMFLGTNLAFPGIERPTQGNGTVMANVTCHITISNDASFESFDAEAGDNNGYCMAINNVTDSGVYSLTATCYDTNITLCPSTPNTCAAGQSLLDRTNRDLANPLLLYTTKRLEVNVFTFDIFQKVVFDAVLYIVEVNFKLLS